MTMTTSPAPDATVEIERRDRGVACLWMNRPALHNAFDERLITGLSEALHALAGDDTVRVIVLGGRGKSFSAGADLQYMLRQGQAGEAENRAAALAMGAVFRALNESRKPTVARVQGAALGGGMGLASACHLCVAAEGAVFATSEVRLGIIPAVISPYVVRAIGERQAYRYFQTAERIDARRALALGLAHEVAPADELDAVLQRVIDALLSAGPKAQAAAVDLVRTVADRPIDDALSAELAHRIATIRSTPEAREGLAGFLDKRSPA